MALSVHNHRPSIHLIAYHKRIANPSIMRQIWNEMDKKEVDELLAPEPKLAHLLSERAVCVEEKNEWNLEESQSDTWWAVANTKEDDPLWQQRPRSVSGPEWADIIRQNPVINATKDIQEHFYNVDAAKAPSSATPHAHALFEFGITAESKRRLAHWEMGYVVDHCKKLMELRPPKSTDSNGRALYETDHVFDAPFAGVTTINLGEKVWSESHHRRDIVLGRIYSKIVNSEIVQQLKRCLTRKSEDQSPLEVKEFGVIVVDGEQNEEGVPFVHSDWEGPPFERSFTRNRRGKKVYRQQRYIQGLTVFVQCSEHPDLQSPVTPEMYLGTGIPVESQHALQCLLTRSSLDLHVGEKLQFDCDPGTVYAISSSVAHSVAPLKALRDTKQSRFTLYLTLHLADSEEDLWEGPVDIKNWKSGNPDPFTVTDGYLEYITTYDQLLRKGTTWQIEHLHRARREFKLSVRSVVSRVIWATVVPKYRGRVMRLPISSSVAATMDPDVRMIGDGEEVVAAWDPSLIEVEIVCEGIMEKSVGGIMSGNELWTEVTGQKLNIDEEVLVDKLLLLTKKRSNWKYVELSNGKASFEWSKRK